MPRNPGLFNWDIRGRKVERVSDGQCHRKQTAFVPPCGTAVMVKRCGKSAPREAQATRHGKPHRVQGQIGNPGAARSRFRESETDSGYRLLRQMILSARKSADRIRLTALPKPFSHRTADDRSVRLQRFKFLRQFKPSLWPPGCPEGGVIPLSATGSLSFPSRSTALTAMTSGWESENVCEVWFAGRISVVQTS